MTGFDRDNPIRFERVSKAYGAHQVLDAFDIELRPGTVTALLGPNGSGKTTALRVLLGLERADAGRALIGGLPYRDLRFPLRHVGALLDASWVHPRRSARAHLTWIAQASGLAAGTVEPALTQVGLLDVADGNVGTFSLGMRQRLGIASTILGDPSVLIYDEPLNGLDQAGVIWVRDFLARQSADGKTVLLSTHMLQEVELTADDVIVIGRRTVLYAGTTAGLSGGAERVVDVDLVDDPALVPLLERLTTEHRWTLHARPLHRGVRPFTIHGASADEVAAVLAANAVAVRRIAGAGSFADAYVRITENRDNHISDRRP